MRNTRTKVLSKLFQVIRKCHCLQKRSGDSETLNIFQINIVRFVAVNTKVSMQVLASEFGIRPSSMTENIDNLVRSGWIIRTRDPDDRRKVILMLSSQAQENLNKIFKEKIKKYSWILSGLDEKQLEMFIEILGTIEETINNRIE